MNKIKTLTLSLLATVASLAMAAPADNAPDILVPTEEGAQVIHGLSNNGKYGVASINPGYDGFSHTVGAVFYDLTGTRPVSVNIGKGHSASGANDVTDDGKIVVGSVDLKPAICRNVDGVWTWEYLPIPDKTISTDWFDDFTGQTTVKTYKVNSGFASAVTPDGKYAVGRLLCDFELYEGSVMWDLEKMEIVETGAPITNAFGEDVMQSRFMQVSNDGRYLLGWNGFSYAGSYVYIFDREKKETIRIDRDEKGNARVDGYFGIDMDGISKSLTSDGHYVAGGISDKDEDNRYPFRFDVWNKKLEVLKDPVNKDVNGWSVTKDGLVLGATPAVFPWADGLVCMDGFFYPFASLYSDVYGLNMESRFGIDNTGKPTLVSDDGRTIVFVTDKDKTYVARFKEDLRDAVQRVKLMANYSVNPASGSKMSKIQSITFSFDNQISLDAGKASSVKLTDSKGNDVAVAKSIQASGVKLIANFGSVDLTEGETYTLTLPAGICWVNGLPNQTNEKIEVKYVGRGNGPVKLSRINPPTGSSLANLDLNDNPIQVYFDAPVMINGNADNRPVAHLYIDGESEAAASLSMDVDLYTNTLIIYPNNTIYLYKGSEYKVEVPAGVVTDISGVGPSEAFSVTYSGSYVPQLGDEVYLFRSDCNSYEGFLFYEGDHGVPVDEYANYGFDADSTPWSVVADDVTSIDMSFASHSVYKDGRQANDWVTTRQLRLPSDVKCYLNFQSQSFRKAKKDYLKVYVYENTQSLGQLTSSTIADILAKGDLVYNELQDPGKSEDLMEGDWRDNTISLEKYMGKDIYICFLNDNKNQSMVMIDNIEVKKDMKAYLSITGNTSVVDQKSAVIKGMVAVQSDIADYKTLSMTLKDAEGKEISKYSATGLSLKGGDTHNFEFPQQLPLAVGVENPFSIEYKLDNDEMTFEGAIRNLAFKPVKRVVVEEQTGNDCQFCPLGLQAMENLEKYYGDQIIPIAVHTYSGDVKGGNMTAYAASVFYNNTAAPIGRINRRPGIYSPMYSDDKGKYHASASEFPGVDPTWQDVVAAELNEPTFLDIEVEAVPYTTWQVKYDVKVKSAINLEDQNIRVLGVLLEDNIWDIQTSGVYSFNDPALGEFANNGEYASKYFEYYFNNVSVGYWGQSANGTSRLIPNTLKANEVYPVEIVCDMPLSGKPYVVENPENLKMAVILIDENTGRVVNAAVSKADVSGVDEIVADGATKVDVSKSGSIITAVGEGDVEMAVFSLDGRVIARANGNGSVSLDLSDYRGLVIVQAGAGGNVVAYKFMM